MKIVQNIPPARRGTTKAEMRRKEIERFVSTGAKYAELDTFSKSKATESTSYNTEARLFNQKMSNYGKAIAVKIHTRNIGGALHIYIERTDG